MKTVKNLNTNNSRPLNVSGVFQVAAESLVSPRSLVLRPEWMVGGGNGGWRGSVDRGGERAKERRGRG